VTLGVPISVDTYKPAVMQAVLDLGADIINDIWALRWRDAPDGLIGSSVIASHRQCGVCVMHMHGEPKTMQVAPMNGDVVSQALSFLELLTQSLQGLGVEKTRICIDPGIGFGKTVEQNFTLLAHQSELLALGYPVLTGWSRKSSLGAVTTLDTQNRMVPSVMAAVLAVQNGAKVVRVHDVKETVQGIQVLAAMQAQRN
jgi:dihydropteroate synthase